MTEKLLFLNNYKNDNIAIYGLGTETENLLPFIEESYNIVGLLDGYRTEGTMYEKEIISISRVKELSVKLILVVARPSSCKVIARRIGDFCKENNIDLYDIRGNNLGEENKVIYEFSEVDGITKSQLTSCLTNADVISTDLFDTLIMRQTMFTTDIYEIVNEKLCNIGVEIEDFALKRQDCEKSLSKNAAPVLKDIYAYMIKKYSIDSCTAEELSEIEWMVEKDYVVKRREICEVFSELAAAGKDIYIVSDSYYKKEQIEELLRICDINFYKDIIVSCEYNTGKTQQLFGVLKHMTVGDKYVHVGDDILADIDSAEKFGIKGIHIYSAVELLEKVGYLNLLDKSNGLSERIRIGMMISRLFNSPFQFERDDRKITVCDAYDIGYIFIAPIVSDFILWMHKEMKTIERADIWFCARDGYLIQKMYEELVGRKTGKYFLTSRKAALRAGVETKDDIKYIEEMYFSGSLSEQIKERFGITVSDERETLMDYSDEILDNADVCRKQYGAYIEALDIKDGNIVFFDFVARGTCQMFMSRLISNHLKGVYFLRLEGNQIKDNNLDIISFYDMAERDGSVVFANYYFLETLLTSPMPSLVGFDDNGRPQYAKEVRSEDEIQCVQKVQKGIIDYFTKYLHLCPAQCIAENKKYDEIMLEMIHKINIENNTFLGFKVEDTFFNRTVDMPSLI